MSAPTSTVSVADEIGRLKDRIRDLETEVRDLEEENENLERAIDREEARASGRALRLAELCRQVIPSIPDPLARYDLQAACEAVEK